VILRALACAAAVAALALTGCAGGGGGSTHGEATLWITRDEGAKVLLVRSVPAGETAMQALERSAKISTRYGGRFVQSIDGLSGSISSRHDWFYFVNGVEADRSAAAYRLRDGDLEWWDYRDWGRFGESVPVVVGAFPEPFLHGYDGRVPPTLVLGPPTAVVRTIANLVHGRLVSRTYVRTRSPSYVLTIVPAPVTRFRATRHGDSIDFLFFGDPHRLLDPSFYRHRYQVP
jgi:hypothetical protein